jgi:membrane fusion protein (multidrug efflux system)
VARDEQGAYVLVIEENGTVAQRRLQLHVMTRSEWIATGEIGAGEQVIVEGLQKVRPGASATAVPAADS